MISFTLLFYWIKTHPARQSWLINLKQWSTPAEARKGHQTTCPDFEQKATEGIKGRDRRKER
jgi:hypothetical protein